MYSVLFSNVSSVLGRLPRLWHHPYIVWVTLYGSRCVGHIVLVTLYELRCVGHIVWSSHVWHLSKGSGMQSLSSTVMLMALPLAKNINARFLNSFFSHVWSNSSNTLCLLFLNFFITDGNDLRLCLSKTVDTTMMHEYLNGTKFL